MAHHDRHLAEVSAELAVAAYELGNLYLEEGSLVRAEYWLQMAHEYGVDGAEDSLEELRQLVDAETSVSDVFSQLEPELARAAAEGSSPVANSPERSDHRNRSGFRVYGTSLAATTSTPLGSRIFDLASVAVLAVFIVASLIVGVVSAEGAAKVVALTAAPALMIAELSKRIALRKHSRPHCAQTLVRRMHPTMRGTPSHVNSHQ